MRRSRPNLNPKKKKKPAQVSVPKPKVRSMARASGTQHQLDTNAKRWLELIKDPCGADLTTPCYLGTGEGYVVRARDYITIPATAVDGVYEFTPGIPQEIGVRWGWADTTGTPLGNASTTPTAAFVRSTVVGRYRPVAACVRVYYTGTELERKGQVGLNLSPGVTLVPGEVIGTNAGGFMITCGKTCRTPGDLCEVKWVPCESDSHWNTSNGDEQLSSVWNSNSITVVFSGVPPGSLRFEYTTVWEWAPAEEFAQSLVTSAKGPSSRNHMNEIISALGDIGKFAYNNYGHRLLPALAQLML